MKTSRRPSRYVVLIACCLANLCIGSLYSWSVFAVPMMQYLNGIGVPVNDLSLVFTVANGVSCITIILGGAVRGRLGVRYTAWMGAILFALGMTASGFARSFTALMVSYGLALGLGSGCVYGCTVSTAVGFFPDRKGMAGGLATSCFGLASVLLPPVANALIESLGITQAFRVLGIAMLVLMSIICQFLADPPTSEDGTQERGKNWSQMIRTVSFWVMFGMLLCAGFAGLMAISQASAICQNMMQMTAATAAIVVAVLALFNAAGRVGAGTLSDKLGCLNTLRLSFSGTCLGMLMLFLCAGQSVWMFIAGIILIGLCFGAVMGLYPSFTAQRFGIEHSNVNYGVMFVGFALAGYFGPAIVSNTYLQLGSYRPAFLVAAALAVMGLLLTFAAQKAFQKEEA